MLIIFLLTFFFVPQITMLINNAGVVSGRALLDTPDHLIERSFNVNVLSHFWVMNSINLISFLASSQVQRTQCANRIFFRLDFRPQKLSCQLCLRKTMVILWQSLRSLDMSVLPNWLTIVPVNLQLLALMRHYVWNSKHLAAMLKPHAFAHTSFNRLECLMMSTQGKINVNIVLKQLKEVHSSAFICRLPPEQTVENGCNEEITERFGFTDGYRHWHRKM